MIHRYSLSDYAITLDIPAIGTTLNGGTITLGGPGEAGEGTFMGDVTVARKSDTWTTAADYTGSWVHSKNLDRSGTVQIDLNQVSDDAIKLYMLTSVYEAAGEGTKGIDITISKGDGESIITAQDCYITKPADMPISGTAANLRWVFTAGKISFVATTAWELITADSEG